RHLQGWRRAVLPGGWMLGLDRSLGARSGRWALCPTTGAEDTTTRWRHWNPTARARGGRPSRFDSPDEPATSAWPILPPAPARADETFPGGLGPPPVEEREYCACAIGSKEFFRCQTGRAPPDSRRPASARSRPRR